MTITLTTPDALAPALPDDRSGARDDYDLAVLFVGSHRSPHTRRAYGRDVAAFLSFVTGCGRTLRTLTARDVLAHAGTLKGAPTSVARRLAAARSLLAFGHRLGYLPFNVGGVVTSPPVGSNLSARILPVEHVQWLWAACPNPRDRVLIRFLYATGARASEVCGLRWKHIVEMAGGDAAVTLMGKGGKERVIRLPALITEELASLALTARRGAVFRSRIGLPMTPAAVAGVVKAAALRAELSPEISPHWLRHAHASHALDAGAPASLVQAQLGHASIATTGRYLHARPSDGTARFLVL